jgi:hypothetical protein
MVGATDTARIPEVAPLGIVIVMDVADQELIVVGRPFKRTWLLPADAPKPVPEITTWLPMEPVVAETLVMRGAVDEVELIETLSSVAVASELVDLLITANPM